MADERLYQLLPAVYRQRDAEQGEPLRALLAVMEAELDTVAADMDGLYENWFIETCAEWVVPYIGDLLGVRGLNTVSPGTFSQRARVANTIAYRRRKGTAAMLEQLGHDVTGWPAKAVEFFALLQTTQYLNHLRPGNRTPDLRDTARLELLGGPVESTPHNVDVRHLDHGGRYNIPNVGLFLWRLQSYPVSAATARPLGGGRYTFDQLGQDIPLFNQPVAAGTAEADLPVRLRRRPLYDELQARRADPAMAPRLYFGQAPVLQVALGLAAAPLAPEQIGIADLSTWRTPTAPITALVDPVLGRLALAPGALPATVEVSYAYGFSADVGAGPYNRQEAAAQALPAAPTWQIGVSQDPALLAPDVLPTLTAALQSWTLQPAGTLGVITVMDSRTYPEDLLIDIPSGSRLLIVGADWPQLPAPHAPGGTQRQRGHYAAEGVRPHLLGNIAVSGARAAGGLCLNGLLIEGALTVQPGDLGALELAHCTLVPGKGGLQVLATDAHGQRNDRLQVAVMRSITGALTLPATVPGAAPRLTVRDSILDSAAPLTAPLPLTAPVLSAPQTDAVFEAVTVLGTAALRTLEAGNCLFAGAVTARLRQSGCVRFSHVPTGSRVARRYRCQPDLALSQAANLADQDRIRSYLVPRLHSRHYGDPAYGQLSQDCPAEIRTGAEDFSEHGAFHHLQQPQRAANLTASLDEYLRFGLEAGLF